MRKINKPLREELPPVKLYLDDLKSICNVLKQKAKSIDITTEDYRVEDINQLKNIEIKKLHRLSINCYDPYISIDFTPSGATIYFAEDSTYNRGILSEIEDILSNRKVFLGRFLASLWGVFLGGMLVGGPVVGIFMMLKEKLMGYV